ncbi:MAG: GYD domain-containing protein [Acidobacteriaceae bacterium]|nr:GYD domain-containing protein [Acidobacteriaceae bacterium]
MAQFLVEAAYTSQSWAALVNNPQDRGQIIQAAVEKLGGKIERAWLSFGDYDAVVIVDMPDSVSAAAFAMAISAGGSCRSVKTIPLLTAQEGLEAMKKAANCGYRPVAQAAGVGSA